LAEARRAAADTVGALVDEGEGCEAECMRSGPVRRTRRTATTHSKMFDAHGGSGLAPHV